MYYKWILAIIIASLTITSCNLFKSKIKIDEVIAEKARIDQTENPAQKRLMKIDLNNKVVMINNILVKDVTESSNIDYDFCVIADVVTNNKKIQCYIYSKQIKTIAEIKKGKTIINAKGNFGRFFTMLDDYYTKLEILDASIKIITEKQDTPKIEEEKNSSEENTKAEDNSAD